MHKNSQKRKFEDYSTYFVTTNTQNRYPYFKHKILCQLFIEELILCKEFKKFNLYGFVVLPDHVHLLIQPFGKNLSNIMSYLKRHFSRDLNLLLGYTQLSHITESEDRDPRFRAVDSLIAKNRNNIQSLHIPKFKWQSSYHDHYIRNQTDFDNHLQYINSNHLKHNLENNYEFVGYNYPTILDL